MADRNTAGHYSQYYKYELPNGKQPDEVVNRLYDRVMRNDAEALEEVIKIFSSKVYSYVKNQLGSFGTEENIEDLMQDINMQVVMKVFRGFPEDFDSEKFYIYLWGIAKHSVKKYLKKKINVREQYDTEESSVFDLLQGTDDTSEHVNPENIVIFQDKKQEKTEILSFYFEALRKTKAVPYQVMTYCYAILLPSLFKMSSNPYFLRQIDVICGRNGKAPNSRYNSFLNRVEGEVARKSSILVNWAIEAMDKQKVEELDQEFLFLYNMVPLTGETLVWGEYYRNFMEQKDKKLGIPIRKIVITESFSRNRIKNWPERVAAALYRDTEEIALKNKGFRQKSVKIVEEMLYR